MIGHDGYVDAMPLLVGRDAELGKGPFEQTGCIVDCIGPQSTLLDCGVKSNLAQPCYAPSPFFFFFFFARSLFGCPCLHVRLVRLTALLGRLK